MEGSAIKSQNYGACLAMPLIHKEDRQETLEEWKTAPFPFLTKSNVPLSLSFHCTGLFVTFKDRNCVKLCDRRRLACECLKMALDKSELDKEEGDKEQSLCQIQRDKERS